MIVSNVTNNQNNQIVNQASATQSNQGVTFTDQPASQATQSASATVQHSQNVANSQAAQASNNNQIAERAQQKYVIPQESTPNPSSNANQQTGGQIAQNQNLTLNRDSNQSVSLNSNGRRIITVNGVNNVQQNNGQITVYSYNNGQVHQFDQNLNMTSGPSAQTIKKNDSRNAIHFSDGQKYQAQDYPEEYIKLSKTQQGLELRKVPTRSTYTFTQEGRENFNFPGRASVQKVSSYQVNNDNSITVTFPDGSTQTLQNNWVETAPASTAGSNFSDDKNSNNDNQNGNDLAANTDASSSVNANNGQVIFQLTSPKGVNASVVKKSDGLYVVSEGASYKISNTTQYDIADNILYYSKGALTNGGSMYGAPYTTADFGKEKPDSSNEVYLGNDSNYTQHGDHLDYGELYSIEDEGNGNVNINSWDAKDPSGWLNFQVQNNKVISIKPQLMAGKTNLLPLKNAKITKSSNGDITVTGTKPDGSRYQHTFTKNLLATNSNNNPSGNHQNSSNSSNTSIQPAGNNQNQPATDQSSTGSNTQQPNTGSNPASNNSTPNVQNKVLEQGSGYQIVQNGNNINVKYNGNVIRSYGDVSNVKSDNQGVHFNAFDNDQYVTFGKPSTLDNNNQLPFNESQTEQTLLNGARTNSNIIYLGDNNTAYSPLSGAIHYDEIIKDGNQFHYLSAGTGLRGSFTNGKPHGLDNSGEAYVTIHNVKVSPNGDISYLYGSTLTHNWLKPSVANTSQNSGSSAGSPNGNNATNGHNDASKGLTHNSQNPNNSSSSTTNANLPSNGSSNPTSGINQGTNGTGSQNSSDQSGTKLDSSTNAVSNGTTSNGSASVNKPITGNSSSSSLNSGTGTGSIGKATGLTLSDQPISGTSSTVTETQGSHTNGFPLNSKKGSVSASTHTVSPTGQSSSINSSPIIGSHTTESGVNGQTGSSTNSKNSHGNLVVNGSIKASQGLSSASRTVQAGKQSQDNHNSKSKDATKGSGSVAIRQSSAAAQSGKGSQHQVQKQPVNIKKNPAKIAKTSNSIVQLASKRATCVSNATAIDTSCATPCANAGGQTAETVVQQSVAPKDVLVATGSSAISASNPATDPVAKQASALASVVAPVSKETSAPAVVQNAGSSSSTMPNTGNDNEIATEFGLVGTGLILGLAVKRIKKSK